jgi:hypothetical protein
MSVYAYAEVFAMAVGREHAERGGCADRVLVREWLPGGLPAGSVCCVVNV